MIQRILIALVYSVYTSFCIAYTVSMNSAFLLIQNSRACFFRCCCSTIKIFLSLSERLLLKNAPPSMSTAYAVSHGQCSNNGGDNASVIFLFVNQRKPKLNKYYRYYTMVIELISLKKKDCHG
ncbi:hypothetical protein BDF20DRAFT_863322 [Mycotypha africana]|uniref:uncharacterized protein n=1 Tax=Mycotypha africana TaxID=64632 RepID=UPI002301B292|nr:uncharacterized protein BDF20DRAFT_863322 [Mycotypha africana]KAI8981800.1 hypothetical protein BDF20DRAFT_863322 [Mycotypha africana]